MIWETFFVASTLTNLGMGGLLLFCLNVGALCFLAPGQSLLSWLYHIVHAIGWKSPKVALQNHALLTVIRYIFGHSVWSVILKC